MHFYTINCFSVDLRAQHADLEKMLALNIRIDKLVLGVTLGSEFESAYIYAKFCLLDDAHHLKLDCVFQQA